MATHNFQGRVTRLYVQDDGVFIGLDLPAAQQPLDEWFRLLLGHPNYNALYTLALVSTVNRYRLLIRTVNDIEPGQRAEVAYMVLDVRGQV